MAATRRVADPEAVPRWLRGGVLRLGGVCLAVWGLGMLSPRVSPHDAGVLLVVGFGIVAGGAVAFVVGSRRILDRLDVPLVGAGLRAAEAALLLLRRVGLLLLAIAFFLVWTVVYLGVWWWDPQGAFTGLPPRPYLSEFFYYAVSTAFISPPGDIVAHTRGARTATMVEMITGAALLSAYLGSFVEWRPGQVPRGDAPDP